MIQIISLNIYLAILIDRNKTSTACQAPSAVLQLPYIKPEQSGQSVTLNNCLCWLLIKGIRSYPAGQRTAWERSRVISQHWAGRAAAGTPGENSSSSMSQTSSKTHVQFSPLAMLKDHAVSRDFPEEKLLYQPQRNLCFSFKYCRCSWETDPFPNTAAAAHSWGATVTWRISDSI